MAAQGLTLRVFVNTGRMQYAWMKASAVRSRLWRPYQCTDLEAPYTRIRWGRK